MNWMFQGWSDHEKIMTRVNMIGIELHQAVEAAFDFHGKNRHAFHRMFAVLSAPPGSDAKICNLSDGKSMTMREGFVYFMPAGAMLEFFFDPYIYFLSFHFNIRDNGGGELYPGITQCCEFKEDTAVIGKIAQIIHAEDMTPVALFHLKHQLFQWMTAVAEKLPFETFPEEELRGKYKELLNFLDEKVNGQTTLEDLAGIAGCSSDTLSRHFSRDFRVPLKQYMLRSLAARAERMLRNPKYNVRETARSLNFQDAYYFSRFFHRETGSTPTDFRRHLGL